MRQVMCGLAGIFAYGKDAPPVDEGQLLRMREAMIVRGPDGAGLWIPEDRRVGLAHRRLAVIDPTPSGAQPMSLPGRGLSIVYNGEIYNYRELAADLKAKGYRFFTQSDTEVLLNSYLEYGIGMLRRLRGMFAFALWDAEKRGLLLARDPLGIKPLYYSDDGGTLRVASQVKALLSGGGIDTSPEPAGHVGFFLLGYVPEPHTLYKGIHSLAAGTSMWIDGKGIGRPEPFFDVRATLAQAHCRDGNADRTRMRDELRQALLDTVRHHLVADVPLGILLSSGVDSTTIAALARQAGMQDLHTITLAFEEFEGAIGDESALAENTARRLGTRHRTRRVGMKEFREDHRRILEAMDQPTIDGVNSYFVSKASAEAGLKVVLSGLGGDELFAGYPSFRQISSVVRRLRPLRSLPWLGRGFRMISAPVLKKFTSPKYAGLLEYGGSFGGAYLLRRGLFMPWELPDFLEGEFVREGWDGLRILTRLERDTEGIESPNLVVSALEMTWYMRNQLLRDSDWAGMAHGVEIRVPLVDGFLLREVAGRLASPIPPTKRDLASASESDLARESAARGKTGFGTPILQWTEELFPSRSERGYRPWALHLYREFA